MGVPGEQGVEPGMGGLTVDLGRMREQNRECVGRNIGRGLLDIVDAEEMRVVDPGKMDLLAVADDRLRFVQQHLYAHVLQFWNHADRVVIAEHAIDRPLRGGRARGRPRRARPRTAQSLAAVVAGQHANVVFEPAKEFDEAIHRRSAHVGMEIAEMKDRESVEGLRQSRRRDRIAAQFDPAGVPAGRADKGRRAAARRK